VISDYGPVIRALGAQQLLLSMTGDEITTVDWGHYGAFPLPASLTTTGGGAIAVEQRSPLEIFAAVRAHSPQTVININHPRLHKAGYFNDGSFDAEADTAHRAGFSFDFDGIEVLNGFQDPDRVTVDQVIADWFALLDHGHLVTATGNSDTHWLSKNIGGYPRNYLYVGTDDYGKIDNSMIAAAFKAHQLFFTTGPFVTVTIGTAGIGDLVSAGQDTLAVAVKVEAAPWIDVDTVQLLVNGNVEKQWHTASESGNSVVRLAATYPLMLLADSYVVVRVDGDDSLFPVAGDRKDFIVYPFALTNPIFIDVDGNRRFDAPLAHGAH
jgi:hypothetical protein